MVIFARPTVAAQKCLNLANMGMSLFDIFDFPLRMSLLFSYKKTTVKILMGTPKVRFVF